MSTASGDARGLRRNDLALWSAGALEGAAIARGLAERHVSRNPRLLTDPGSVLLTLGCKNEAVRILHTSLTLDPEDVQVSESYRQRLEALGANTEDAQAWAEDLVKEIRASVTTSLCGNDYSGGR